MRVLVTGSRDWPNDFAVDDTLSEVESGRGSPGDPFVVIHGACPTGADAYAARWVAQWSGYPVPGGEYVTEERHPADWSLGRKAGPERNAAMVATGADLCLAFIGPCTSPRCRRTDEHWSHGATGCANLAELAGIETRRVYLAPLCACGCPDYCHVGEIGCPCALPGEPPCAPRPGVVSPREGRRGKA